MSALFPPSKPSSRYRHTHAHDLRSRSSMLRVALVSNLFAAGLAAAAVAPLAAPADIEPELLVLLHGMALVKAAIAIAAAGLGLWRFGWPVSTAAAIGYVAGIGCLVAGTVLIASLSFIVVAAVLFHFGLFGLLIVAWRDDRFSPNDPAPRPDELARANVDRHW